MACHIAELRTDQIDAAIAFAAELGCEVVRDKIRNTMSLVACEDETIIGLSIACETNNGQIDLYVGFNEKQGDMTLARKLADKALQKIHSHQIHHCHIVPVGAADTPEFWKQVNWLDLTLGKEDVA